jgi:23S rRNA (uracil1939-C5)-methyltransferase
VFIQNNFHQSLKIYSEINSLINQGPVLDLYSGIGITSLILAKKGLKVTSVEVNRASVEMARKNGQMNGLAGVNYLTGDAKAIAKLSGNFYAAIVNPPREGLEEQVIHELLRLKPRTILYISCNPSTLARDLVKFKGYGIKSVKAFDMFPQTGHIETLVQLVSL